jgi:hypothetical protein
MSIENKIAINALRDETGYLRFLEERHRTLSKIGKLLPFELRGIAEMIEAQRAKVAALEAKK